ncbi:MAG: multiheme c-type cytochrome, partial [Planctomycetota bacterium]
MSADSTAATSETQSDPQAEHQSPPATTAATRSTQFRVRRILIVGLTLLFLVCGSVVAADYMRYRNGGDTYAQRPTFVGRDACIDCHRDQSDSFNGSHHDWAMHAATEESVRGDFNDVTFENDGIVSRMFRDGPRYMIHTEGPDGAMADFEIRYILGWEPLQQYMVEFDRAQPGDGHSPDGIGRLQVLRISWDVENQQWFYLRPPDVDDKIAPDDDLHWTGIAQRWQTMCAECHSTNLKTGFDPTENRYHTTYSEIDVSCEACHGPGSVHVELAKRTSLFWDAGVGFGLNRLKGENTLPQIETCAPCHSRRGPMAPDFCGGATFHQHYQLERMQPSTYHADGQIKDEVYVYGSFIQSKMYHKGIRCTDCHDPHSLKLKHPGNETCTSCHQHSAGKYDAVSHHHHQPGTPGAMCVNCHMPHTTYMAIDTRRDHSLRVPRPDLSVKLGTPNACSACHLNDQKQLQQLASQEDALPSLDYPGTRLYQDWQQAAQSNEQVAAAIRATDEWCAQACQQWYPNSTHRGAHYSETMVRLRQGQQAAVEELDRMLTKPEAELSAFAKASLMDAAAPLSNPVLAKIARRVAQNEDQHSMVRSAAIDSFRFQAPRSIAAAIPPLLEDADREVRFAAAQLLV